MKQPHEDDEGALPVLVLVDDRTGCVFAGVVSKGVNQYAVHIVIEALKFLGRQRVILLTDAEPSIKALAEAVSREFKGEAQLMTAPRESHASNGVAERGILEFARQVRTVVSALESRFKEFKVLPGEKAWVLTRYLIKRDGKTPYERLRGRQFNGEIVEPYEFVHFKLAASEKGKLDGQTSKGVWLGKSLNSDEHLIASKKGVRRCRSIWRMPEAKRWNSKAFEEWTGLPWQPRGTPSILPGTPGLQVPGTPVPTTPGGGKRGVYITLNRRIEHGRTTGCPGCNSLDDDPKPHNKECRARFEEIIAKEKDKEAAKKDVEMGAGGTALTDAGGSASKTAGGTASELAGSTATKAGGTASGNAGGTASQSSPDAGSTAPEESGREAKRSKTDPATQVGQKREAETSVAVLEEFERDLLAAACLQTEEIIAGFPTLHEIPIASYPEWAQVENVLDERSGEMLEPEKVRRARNREMVKMDEHGEV